MFKVIKHNEIDQTNIFDHDQTNIFDQHFFDNDQKIFVNKNIFLIMIKQIFVIKKLLIKIKNIKTFFDNDKKYF